MVPRHSDNRASNCGRPSLFQRRPRKVMVFHTPCVSAMMISSVLLFDSEVRTVRPTISPTCPPLLFLTLHRTSSTSLRAEVFRTLPCQTFARSLLVVTHRGAIQEKHSVLCTAEGSRLSIQDRDVPAFFPIQLHATLAHDLAQTAYLSPPRHSTGQIQRNCHRQRIVPPPLMRQFPTTKRSSAFQGPNCPTSSMTS